MNESNNFLSICYHVVSMYVLCSGNLLVNCSRSNKVQQLWIQYPWNLSTTVLYIVKTTLSMTVPYLSCMDRTSCSDSALVCWSLTALWQALCNDVISNGLIGHPKRSKTALWTIHLLNCNFNPSYIRYSITNVSSLYEGRPQGVKFINSCISRPLTLSCNLILLSTIQLWWLIRGSSTDFIDSCHCIYCWFVLHNTLYTHQSILYIPLVASASFPFLENFRVHEPDPACFRINCWR